MTTTTGIESDVHDRLDKFCDNNGMQKQYVVSRAVEDWLDEQAGGEE